MALGFSNTKKCPNELAVVYSGMGRIFWCFHLVSIKYTKWQYVDTTEVQVRSLMALGSQMQSITTFPDAHTGTLFFRYGQDIIQTSGGVVCAYMRLLFSCHLTIVHIFWKKKDRIVLLLDSHSRLVALLPTAPWLEPLPLFHKWITRFKQLLYSSFLWAKLRHKYILVTPKGGLFHGCTNSWPLWLHRNYSTNIWHIIWSWRCD